VPEVLLACEGIDVIGAPFYVMTFVPGQIPEVRLPSEYGTDAPRLLAEEAVTALIALHEIDYEAAGLGDFGRPDGYLERQVKVFRSLLESTATRPLTELEQVADWLVANLPRSGPPTIVHGDYRLGNLMFAAERPRLVAVLDWEMATLGDPLADLGYMIEMWATDDDLPNPVHELSPVTRQAGFPSRDDLIARYGVTGRNLDALPWYRVLAVWKAAIFLEGNYKRFLEGTTSDPFYKTLREGVPMLAALATRRSEEL
jgi:aminoglycoside phosphotransferase (APT) family kinase protein